jgi:hypothetical protein
MKKIEIQRPSLLSMVALPAFFLDRVKGVTAIRDLPERGHLSLESGGEM